MLWSKSIDYVLDEFANEADFESAIEEVKVPLFGESRVYISHKKIIGKRGKTRNVPDAFLLDLSSVKEPKLYVIENEIARHEPLKHIAVQILEFSLSYESSRHRIKETVKEGLAKDPESLQVCANYAADNGFENVDVLLETIVHAPDSFNVLLIIDDISEDLQTALISRFKFPVEIVTLQRYKSRCGNQLYRFDPFLYDVSPGPDSYRRTGQIDPAELDTIVVPAREDGFKDTFIHEQRWYEIRIHSTMIPRIKYIAAYRVKPISAITHIAKVESIEQWEKSSKYVVNFSGPAESIGPLRLIPRGKVKPLQAPRYASSAKLRKAHSLDEAF